MYSNPWGWAILQGNSVCLLTNICFYSWSKSIIILSCWSFSYFVVDHGPPCIYVDHCPPWKMCWLLSIISVDQIVRPLLVITFEFRIILDKQSTTVPTNRKRASTQMLRVEKSNTSICAYYYWLERDTGTCYTSLER